MGLLAVILSFITLMVVTEPASKEYKRMKLVTAEIKRQYPVEGMHCVEFAEGAKKILESKGYIAHFETVSHGHHKRHRIVTVEGKDCKWVIDNRHPTRCRDWFTHYTTEK